MQTIQDKHIQALSAYTRAREALEAKRTEHEEGAGKAYAGLLAQQNSLKAKIAEQETAAAAAEGSFKRLFAEAGHEVTKNVKAALFSKNDALSIAEELRSALADSEAASVDAEIAASGAARDYQSAYRHAQAAYALVQVYQALSECGEAMARAVAFAMHVPGENYSEAISRDVPTRRAELVWNELLSLANTLPEAQRMPQVTELGSLDLGAFANRAFVSPAKASLMRTQRATGAALTTEAAG